MFHMLVNKIVSRRTGVLLSHWLRSVPQSGILIPVRRAIAQQQNTDSLESKIRAGYWIIGIVAGAFLTYSTRHFINGDAINYIEMGEAFRMGRWSDLVNLTASPGYAFLLGLGQLLLDTNRWNEVPLLKWVNFICMIFALGVCDLFVQYLRRRSAGQRSEIKKPLPQPLVLLLTYGMCLFCVFNWIRPRLIAPEMVVFGLVLATAAVILWIKDDPRPYFKFVVLGMCAGVSYLFKTFFFPFALVFFGLAALATRSVRLGGPRLLVSLLVMLLVSAPLLYGLSAKTGRFSFGETGKLNYAKYIAGRGESVHSPIELTDMPGVFLYRDNPYVNSTRPASFDPSYWTQGIEPVFSLTLHLKLLLNHLWEIFDDRPVLSIYFFLWCLWLLYAGALRPRQGWAPSGPLLLALLGVAGMVLYSIIHVEMRYVAPFLFLGFLAVVIHQRHDWTNAQQRSRATAFALVLAGLTLCLTASSVVDQALRGLRSTADKPSYSEAYAHLVALKDFLQRQGIQPGTDVALVGMPAYYWGRMAGLRIIAEIPSEEELLTASEAERDQAFDALQEVGVNLVVASGKAFQKLHTEGWQQVPGTRDFYVYMRGQPDRPGMFPPARPVISHPEYRTANGAPVALRSHTYNHGQKGHNEP